MKEVDSCHETPTFASFSNNCLQVVCCKSLLSYLVSTNTNTIAVMTLNLYNMLSVWASVIVNIPDM